MLVVQRITTRWTKAARGGAAAAHRNAVPLALLLPALAGSEPGYLLHDVEFPECDGFARRERVTESNLPMHLHIGPLILGVTTSEIAVRFLWSRSECGAPERYAHEPFCLARGEWGRFMFNGRFGADSSAGRAWEYHRTVFNMAWPHSYDRKFFLESAPDFEDARLAILR